ncbi:MAG TPA: UDP-N-acetylmuramoyl-L-alanine--D-glutamate ligase [Stellaceae bacterium]|jgi:UDP-N-acetylmuramoylalanine--D-glutamate ligase|nr:UDP-N-acetylmuramoyl-L-alanine--D-glutamate ligase [Stellaceae bacterium]
MVPVTGFAGRKVGVLGLARSGRAAVAALIAGGAEVLAWDDNEKAREAVDFPLNDAAEWRDVAALILSPGIPTTFPKPHPAVIRAREAGIEIIGDLELLFRAQREARFIGITGTNGKSTTTALIGHILREAGLATEIGGNLGTAALSLAPLGAGGTYVLEASSYQLELLDTMACDIAVLLNITPDHLDRHGGMDGYIAAKEHIFDRQGANATAVIGVDDDICLAMAERLRRGARRVVPVSVNRAVSGGVYVESGHLVDAIDTRARRVLDLATAERLPGAHNWQNACAAYAVARRAGLSEAVATAAIHSFPGLAHRQELVDTLDGVRYINDSKATNADASEKALICYPAIYWIAGGLAKTGGIAPLAPYFGRLRHTFLIGNATEEFAATLDGKTPYTRCGDLTAALAAADRMARAEHVPGAVVLLSPACASFDQFSDFEARGDRFRDLVASLPRG